MRKIKIDGEDWEYMIGKKNAIFAKESKKLIVPLEPNIIPKLVEDYEDDLEIGRCAITPNMICNYISKNKLEILQKMGL